MTDNDTKTLAGPDAYRDKGESYFNGSREDFVAMLPSDADARIVEVGCGYGDTGASALKSGKCRVYCGVEIYEPAAEVARKKLSDVIVGDVENLHFPWSDGTFDALILSEVLEHLVDPATAIRRLRRLLRPGAMVLASSPNVSHYSIIGMLFRGNWAATDRGAMDRTHLRWFTPRTFRAMFTDAGFDVAETGPVTPFSLKTRLMSRCFGGKIDHLFMRQISLRGYNRSFP